MADALAWIGRAAGLVPKLSTKAPPAEVGLTVRISAVVLLFVELTEAPPDPLNGGKTARVLPVMVIVYVVLSVVEDETLKLLAGVIYFQSAVSAFVIFVTFPALSIVVTGFWPVVVVVATVTV